MRRLVAVVFVGALLAMLLFPGTARACSCGPKLPPADALKGSNAVFWGRVSAIERIRTVEGYERVVATFEVAEVWKGEVGRQSIVYTGTGGGDCGFGFSAGAEYLVYAGAFADAKNSIAYGLSVGICGRTTHIGGAAADLAVLGPGQPPSDHPQPQVPPEYTYSPQCFPQTGKYIDERFYYAWKARGGLAVNGYPLTEARVETLEDGKGYLVQWFERTRLEFHQENAYPNDILLGQFGRSIHPADPPVAQVPGARYFAETGHNVTRAEFVAYWDTFGGLAQFGYPLSEEMTETLEDGRQYRVQYFERARFEWHPENADPYRVLLGQFGRRLLAAQPEPSSAPAPTPGQRVLQGHGDCVTDVAFSRDGSMVASGSYDGTIRLWDVQSGETVRVFTGHLDRVQKVALSSDGRFLASASDDCSLRIWNPTSGALLHTLYPHSCEIEAIAFSPDSRYLASGGNHQIILWDPGRGTEVRQFAGEPYPVSFLTFSPDGRTLAGGNYFRQIILWDVATGQPRPLPWQQYDAISAVFTPDGQQLISGSRFGGELTVWDLNTSQAVRTLKAPGCGVNLLAISPDGQTLISGGYRGICLWDFGAGAVREVLNGHENRLGGLQLNASGTMLVSGGYDTTVRLWKVGP